MLAEWQENIFFFLEKQTILTQTAETASINFIRRTRTGMTAATQETLVHIKNTEAAYMKSQKVEMTKPY